MKLFLALLFTLPFMVMAKGDHKGHKEKGHHERGNGPCAQLKCFQEKDPAARKQCRAKKRECKQEHFSKKLEEFKTKGIPEERRSKIVQRVSEKLEMKKAHLENLTEDIEFFENHLKAIKALPAKK